MPRAKTSCTELRTAPPIAMRCGGTPASLTCGNQNKLSDSTQAASHLSTPGPRKKGVEPSRRNLFHLPKHHPSDAWDPKNRTPGTQTPNVSFSTFQNVIPTPLDPPGPNTPSLSETRSFRLPHQLHDPLHRALHRLGGLRRAGRQADPVLGARENLRAVARDEPRPRRQRFRQNACGFEVRGLRGSKPPAFMGGAPQLALTHSHVPLLRRVMHPMRQAAYQIGMTRPPASVYL